MSSKKSAFVTGTSKGGIGDYLAQELYKRGFRVFATARDSSKVQHLKDMGLDIILLDVTDPEGITRAAAEVSTATGGTLDILINNSGIVYKSSLIESDIDAAKALFDVNVFGVLNVTKAFSPLLMASKGTVINIGSVIGRLPIPFQGIYNASKAALEQVSRTLRIELAPFDVKVIHVITGGIKTDFFAHGGNAEFSEDSPYYPGRAVLTPWLNGTAQEKVQRTTPEAYAKNVIDNALSGSPTPIHWVGYGARETWFTSRFLWDNAWEFVLRVMKLPDMKEAISGQKK